MLVELTTAAVFMVQSNYPLESTSNYHAYFDKRVEQIDLRHERQKARMEARQEARRQARQEARRQARQEAIASTQVTTTVTSSTPPSSGLPPLLALIRHNESRGDYSAYNASGCEGYGCYGAYQLHGLYMDDWARRYGAAAYAGTPANQWPPSVQDKVALGLFYSTNPDGAFWCNWTDYC